ncbi:hypothetical protein ACJMK2_027259 [Sinanodonta woodiana]|uniref:Uncharacterized protein n=1 Tax=Sinanodonta woodiana TaxID=1069815 RepID=A0ABD3XQI6_SINWO
MTLKDWILEGFKDIPAQPSCTSLPQQWDKPRGGKIKAEPVSTMVIAKPGNINRKRKPITALFEDNRKIQLKETDISFLQGLKGCPLSYLVTPPEHTTQTEQGPQNIGSPLGYHIPLIKAVEIPGQQHTDCGDLDFPEKTNIKIPSSVLENTNRWSNVALSEEDAIALERNTRDQNICDQWYKERESRITASNFGRFMLRKACLTDKIFKKYFQTKAI